MIYYLPGWTESLYRMTSNLVHMIKEPWYNFRPSYEMIGRMCIIVHTYFSKYAISGHTILLIFKDRFKLENNHLSIF